MVTPNDRIAKFRLTARAVCTIIWIDVCGRPSVCRPRLNAARSLVGPPTPDFLVLSTSFTPCCVWYAG